MNRKRIEILGCTASGKTTLCNTLASLGWNVIYEPYRKNPFLLDFFHGASCGFELQTCFLLQHYNAIQAVGAQDIICDFSFALDAIYASLLLNSEEINVYKVLLDHLTSIIGKPYCLIKLICSDETIIHRLQKRNRDYEKSISLDFVKELNCGVKNYTSASRCIEIDSTKIDISNPDEVKLHLLSYL